MMKEENSIFLKYHFVSKYILRHGLLYGLLYYSSPCLLLKD